MAKQNNSSSKITLSMKTIWSNVRVN